MRPIDADALLKDINENYDLNYGETLIDPCRFAELVEAAPTIEQPTWISVDERLPTAEDANRFGEVLAITKNLVSSYPYEWIRRDKSNYYMYWLPFSALPEPPKGVE